MASLTFGNVDYALEKGESVLDGLTRHGQTIPHSCEVGSCQSCLMQAKAGDPGSMAQAGLNEALKAQNFFLACRCFPDEALSDEALSVALPSMADTTVEAEIVAIEMLCHDIVALRLRPVEQIFCRPGQFISIVRDGGSLIRSYSVANLPERDGYLELHIRKITDGRVSSWAHDDARIGEKVTVRGPAGNCFYIPSDEGSYPILLAGTGTGLAPLEGIVLDALAQGHTGPIHLLHGALREDDFYHIDLLRALVVRHENVSYTPCVLHPGTDHDILDLQVGPLDEFVDSALGKLEKASLRTYFCGAPEMVNLLKRKAFMAGVASRNNFSDPFVIAADRRS